MARAVTPPKQPIPGYRDRETTYNDKVSSKGYYIMKGNKLLGANPTYAGALRTANAIGPDIVVVPRGKRRVE